MAIGKVVVQRQPFDYLKYPDTPPHVSMSVMESDANNDTSTMESGMFWDDYCIPAECTDSRSYTAVAPSPQSSLASDDSGISTCKCKSLIFNNCNELTCHLACQQSDLPNTASWI
ncbi:hypothetical protein BC941DRAFT_517634 [Chlamydoabsidia padenii]|nr:hypothetical protein BC941DRAFT_517634 [Chlamydoabsidia padenii]